MRLTKRPNPAWHYSHSTKPTCLSKASLPMKPLGSRCMFAFTKHRFGGKCDVQLSSMYLPPAAGLMLSFLCVWTLISCHVALSNSLSWLRTIGLLSQIRSVAQSLTDHLWLGPPTYSNTHTGTFVSFSHSLSKWLLAWETWGKYKMLCPCMCELGGANEKKDLLS